MQAGIGFCACLIIVVDKLYESCTAVSGAVTPVVDNIIADVERTAVGHAVLLHSTGKRPVASGAVDEEIVVEATDIAADGCRKSVRFRAAATVACIVMHGIMQRFTDDVPLKCNIRRAS